MKTKYLFLILAFSLVTLIITGCKHPAQSTQAESYQYTDDYNNTITIPSNPQRIVSLSPAVTEIIFDLGKSDLLVGRTDFCTYPEEALQIESVGGISNLNVEKILSLHPDLVISGSMIPQKAAEHLHSLGVPLVCVIEKTEFDGLYENISKIGQLVGCSNEADSLNQTLREAVQAVDSAIQNYPTAYYVVGFGANGNFTAGGNTFINDLIRMAGGRNIAEGVQGWSYSLEALMSEDPDFIIVRREDSADFCNLHPYSSLSAVRSGHVIGIVSGTLDLQVPRNIDAILYLRNRFHQ